MIPMHVTVSAPGGPRKVNVEILDLPSITPLAMQVVLLNSLLESNENSESLSYHVTGSFDLTGFPPSLLMCGHPQVKHRPHRCRLRSSPVTGFQESIQTAPARGLFAKSIFMFKPCLEG